MDQLCNTEQWYICATFYEAVRTLRRVTTVRCTNDVKLCSDVCLGRQIFFVLFLSRTSGRCILWKMHFNAFVHSCTCCCIFTMLISHCSDTNMGTISVCYYREVQYKIFPNVLSESFLCAVQKPVWFDFEKLIFSFSFSFSFFFFFPSKACG